jgi:RNase P subunit RPR2
VGSDFDKSLHLLVFACGKCASPIAVSKTSTMRSLEEVDASSFSLKCPCGWTGKLIGLQARKHS